jgi:hypothetical protein
LFGVPFRRPEAGGLESQLLPRLELKLVAPNRPHPGAPDTPPGNVVAGLAAKMFDAARARAGLRK